MKCTRKSARQDRAAAVRGDDIGAGRSKTYGFENQRGRRELAHAVGPIDPEIGARNGVAHAMQIDVLADLQSGPGGRTGDRQHIRGSGDRLRDLADGRSKHAAIHPDDDAAIGGCGRRGSDRDRDRRGAGHAGDGCRCCQIGEVQLIADAIDRDQIGNGQSMRLVEGDRHSRRTRLGRRDDLANGARQRAVVFRA
jgi:hypothetical protein